MLLKERGYEVRLIDDIDGVLTPEAFASAVDSRTAVVATSLIHPASGFRVDLDGLKTIVAGSAARLVVDASQALGGIQN